VLNQYSRSGLELIGIKHFGQILVNGLSLVPNPAARSNAFILYDKFIYLNI